MEGPRNAREVLLSTPQVSPTTGRILAEEKQRLFGDADIVSTYSDAEAVEDGLLVAINPKDRVTRTVWEYLVQKAPKGSQPPNRWPVDLMTWFRCDAIKREDALKMIAEFGKDEAQKKFDRMIADRKALALSKGIISTHSRQAARVYEENIDGGIYKLYAVESPDGMRLTELSASESEDCSKSVLWLLPNENSGITLMFPEDY